MQPTLRKHITLKWKIRQLIQFYFGEKDYSTPAIPVSIGAEI